MSSFNAATIAEAKQISSLLKNKFHGDLDGKTCILEMKERKLNWKQMEWLGWYVEEMGRIQLIQELGGSIGPAFGRTKFDYQRFNIWDIKVHTNNTTSGWCILNDLKAIESIISDTGGIGFFIALADVEYDNSGQFKMWHDKLKGKISDYEKERVKRGAKSRRRKTSCHISEWQCIFINDFEIFIDGMSDGWVSVFQKGMRNANGSPRREKIMINLHSLPSDILIE
ncbi:MAG TPA: hypothetical protein C5S50_00775 [Methanosarcinaceae archaeon]|nr:hypothetical protein [Methanosarcinaceae archaeon]